MIILLKNHASQRSLLRILCSLLRRLYFIYCFFTALKIFKLIKTSNLEGGLFLFHFHFASFLKFMVANLSLTHFVTCARPLYGVYLIANVSFASANTLSRFSFRSLYKSAYLGICLIFSAISM